MIGIGALVNAAAVLAGGGLGLLIKSALRPRFSDILMKANGLAVLFIGAAGAMSGLLLVGEDGRLSSGSPLLLICALTLGGLLGEWVRIEDRMEQLGIFLQKKMGRLGGGRFSEGFVTNTLVICVGAMAVVGAFNDGLLGDPTLLYTKALLDGVISMVFAGTLGVGVLFAALPLGIYQGALTIAARLIAPLVSDALLADLSLVGSVLVFAIGINLTFGKRIKAGNLLPALLIPPVWHGISALLG